uniref:G-protein coupled receptors family 3 profile domain-containing protein n=1 Tax=Eptatretus burgeri TaxID=7764 RepID=A0A8C4QJT8_EPTBU
MSVAGDVIIGGLFPITIILLLLFNLEDGAFGDRINERGLRWFMISLFAIMEVNKNSDLLPDTYLGFVIFDSCKYISKAMRGSLNFLSESFASKKMTKGTCTPHVVIAPSTSSIAVPLSRLMERFSIPLISYAASCKCLSDKKMFPFFLRTIPSDDYQATAIAHLVRHFQWVYVGVVAIDDAYGKSAVAQFLAEAEQHGLCVAFNEVLHHDHNDENLKNIGKIGWSRPVLVIAGSTLISLLGSLVLHNNTGKTWLASEAWINVNTLNVLHDVNNTHSFSQEDFWNAYVIRFWEEMFNCTFNMKKEKETVCTGKEKLDEVSTPFIDVSKLQYSYNVYIAVYAVAHAIQDIKTCKGGFGPFQNLSCASLSTLEHWQLLFYLRKVRFVNNMGNTVYFDRNGDPPAIYELFNKQLGVDGELYTITVGIFNSSASQGWKLKINESAIRWNGGARQPHSVCSQSCLPGTRKMERKAEPFCCFDCIHCTAKEYSNVTDSTECHKCMQYYWSTEMRDGCVPMPEVFLTFSEPLALALLACAVLGNVLIMAIGLQMFLHRNLPIMKDTDLTVWLPLLLSISFCFISSLSFIGQPSEISCRFHEAPACAFFTVAIICVMNMTLQLVKNSKYSLSSDAVLSWLVQQNGLCSTFALAQIVLCVAWVLIGSTKTAKDEISIPGFLILECVRTSIIWLSCSLSYLGLMMFLSLYLALSARKLVTDSSELKFITFSILFCFLVCLAFVPAYNSIHGKMAVAVKVFAVTTTAYGILGCIFLPKCYMIFVK